MITNKRMLKAGIILVMVLAVLNQTVQAYAWEDRGRHYYRDGRWYRHGWMGFDIAVSALAIGAIVESLPPRSTTVVVGGVPYYYYDTNYYRPYPGGYVVVPPPVVTQPIIVAPEAAQPVMVAAQAPAVQAQPQAPNTVTINIPNSRGGYTAITLKKYGNGYIGPQGEYYSENPTVEQLKTLYGK